MMPISGTDINGCDCPGGITLVSGVLIDGVIPSIDTTQQGWASELFTVNRNGRDSIMIGFQLLSEFYLRGIELTLFNCPIQGIGISGVQVYSSFVFPHFVSTASTLLITHNSLPRDNCQSLSTISILVQPPMSSYTYFVEFLFIGGSTVHQLNWLCLGEIRFSDETSTTIPIVTTETTTENEGKIQLMSLYQIKHTVIQLTVLTEPNPANTTTGYLPTTSSFLTQSNIHTATKENITITDDINSDAAQSNVASISNYINVSKISSVTTSIQIVTNSEFVITLNNPNSTTITVAALAGVIGLLIILLIGVCGFFLYCFFYRKHKSSLNEAPQNQDINALATAITCMTNRINRYQYLPIAAIKSAHPCWFMSFLMLQLSIATLKFTVRLEMTEAVVSMMILLYITMMSHLKMTLLNQAVRKNQSLNWSKESQPQVSWITTY